MNFYGSRLVKQHVCTFSIQNLLSLDEKPCAYGWGKKPSFNRAKHYAQKNNVPLICLEDGFIRSLGLGKEGYAPLSIVADQTGIYFDSVNPSDLEALILQPESVEWNARAKCNIEKIKQYSITKYNQKFSDIDTSLFNTGHHVLVVDQTFGDQSIHYAGASETAFQKMLQQALHDHPSSTIWVKVHPDVLAGKSKGHFQAEDLEHQNIKILSENYNPLELLAHMHEVYVVSSQLGFEALLCDKKVHCFAMPWYAGWGLTNDQWVSNTEIEIRRNVARTLEHLFACAYLKYARYISPITHQSCELEDILKLLIPNIDFQQQLDSQLVAYGFSPWKKKFIRDFLAFPNTQLKFKNLFNPHQSDTVVCWGKKAHRLKTKGYSKVMTVEDGFIRSVGLGAKLIRPCSLVFDPIGIYYDATQPSRLENLLNSDIELNPQQVNRTQNLMQSLIDLNITKYNVGDFKPIQHIQNNKKIILVVGQVEDDMSIQLGGVDIKTNLDLLKAVRENNPDAYIIYKPHPDVHEGLRVGYIKDKIIYKYADHLENSKSILECFNICDELHTISSLSGFEALIRGIKVYCYGLPFYAGWGLTTDKFNCARRNKKISLEKLVYMALIAYPVYNLPQTSKMNISLVNPEDVVEYIRNSRNV